MASSIKTEKDSQNELGLFLYGIANILRGPINQDEYKSYITPILFFKRLSDVYDEETEKALEESGGDEEYASFDEQHSFIITEGCHWKDVRNKSDNIGADYRVLARAWDAISPDPMLSPYRRDYIWLTKVYESVRPIDGSGKLIWASLGPKTIALIHQNMTVGDVKEDVDVITLYAELVETVLKTGQDPKKITKKVIIDLVARIQGHSGDPKYKKLGEKLEELKEQHEQGLLNSIEFLKALLELAKETAQAEKEVVPEEEIDKGKNALTELFNGIKNRTTPIIVTRVVDDIDAIVKRVRFDGWQNTLQGKKDIKKELRKIIWIKYQIKDSAVFDKACSYVEMYY